MGPFIAEVNNGGDIYICSVVVKQHYLIWLSYGGSIFIGNGVYFDTISDIILHDIIIDSNQAIFASAGIFTVKVEYIKMLRLNITKKKT